jgi:excisionase family DNA binding protein
MINENYLAIGQTASLFGVTVATIRRWCKSGKIKESTRTFGNHRRFSLNYLRNLLGYTTDQQSIGYARVSSHDQKNDLITQAEALKEAGCDEVITDLGSGMNCKKYKACYKLPLKMNYVRVSKSTICSILVLKLNGSC